MGRKKLVRKAEPPAKPRIVWPRWTGFRGMTVRDWLQLLIVPLALAGVGVVFTLEQDARQRELEEQRAQDAALQAYLDQMSQLILQRDLLESEAVDPAYTLAQARTSTIILRLNAQHNESVIRFLSDSGLTRSGESSVSLLRRIALSGADLYSADLTGADLSDANLIGADLTGAYLVGTNLRGADLNSATLYAADLSDANLRDAFLLDADLRAVLLVEANLYGARLPFANLSDADLSEADLSGAQGVTEEELEQEAETLEGATLPNGQKYEDWIKTKEDRALPIFW